MSDDGSRIIYKAFLGNGNPALLLAERNIGMTSIWVDFTNIPVPGGAAVQVGDTWSYQI